MVSSINDNDNNKMNHSPPSILKHFLIAGLTTEHLKQNKTNPQVISSFTMEQNKSELSTIMTLINNDTNTISNIFPCRSDYLNQIDFNNDNNQQQLDDSLYVKEYIVPYYLDPFFHCFIYKYWGEKDTYDWYFNCFVFFEELTCSRLSSALCSNTSNTNGIPVPVFVGKAMIIITKEPYFILCKKLLKTIYSISTRRNSQKHLNPIEPFIINIFNRLRFNNNTDLDIKIDTLINYRIKREQFFPICDMNLYLFFQLFTLSDVLFLAEQFFRKRTIIIISSSFHSLYPIFHILMTLIHPLNLTDNTYVYRLFTPTILNVISNDFPMFLFFYANKISDEVISAVARKREYTTVITMKYKKNKQKPKIQKLFYQSEIINKGGEDEYTKLNILKAFPQSSIIHQIMMEFPNSETLFGLIQSAIKNIKANKKTSFFYSDDYIDLRQFFFGLMSRFFVSIMPPMSFHISEKKKEREMIIDIVQAKLPDFYDKFIKELVTTPTFDIIKKVALTINHPNLKDIILLDELIKIIKVDSHRLYYDFKTFESLKSNDGSQKGGDSMLGKNLLVKPLLIESKPMYEKNKMVYLSEINKLLLRQRVFGVKEGRESDLELTSQTPFRLLKKDNQYHVLYNSISFDFSLYTQLTQIELNRANGTNDLLFKEIEAFSKLLHYGCIPSITLEEITDATSALCLSLLIINNLITEKFSHNVRVLHNLFQYTDGFNRKFNFLISFLYEIILSNEECSKVFMNKFMDSLQAFNILPTVTIVLKFKYKMKSIVDNNSFDIINGNGNANVNSNQGFPLKIISQNVITKECDGDAKDLDKKFKCLKCKKALMIKTLLGNEDEIEHELISPLIILNKMLETILKNKSVLIKDINSFYDKWLNDILNIAFLKQKISFPIELFR